MLRKSFAFLLVLLPLSAVHAQMAETLSPKCKKMNEAMGYMQDEIDQYFHKTDRTAPIPVLFDQSYQEIGVHNHLALQFMRLRANMDFILMSEPKSDAVEGLLVNWEAMNENGELTCGDLTKLQPFSGHAKEKD